MKYFVTVIVICCYGFLKAQLPVTIPWSSTVNEIFPSANYQLPPGKTDFTYTANLPLQPGYYSIIPSLNDAGHIFIGYSEINNKPSGYKMIAEYNPAFTPRDIYRDTVHNICGNTRYLFWAGINNVTPLNCLKPGFTMSIESLDGTAIASFQTGKIGGPNAEDNYSWYVGYYDRLRPPPVPFYGGSFILPAGVTDVVVKITTNADASYPACTSTFEIDNIILMPIGPDIRISSVKYPGGWVTGSCFTGNVPVEITSKIEEGFLDFGTRNYVLQQYASPAYQWQQSLDEGYTWMDIPGQTYPDISQVFAIPDTFWIRLRVSETSDIANRNCSNVSNIVKVEVDGLPNGFNLTTNSPVCTDGDLKLMVEGGASYETFGPNGFYDNSAFPHRYHPAIGDSGWYYSEMQTFGGCKVTDSTSVKITGPILDTSLLKTKTICYGDTTRLGSGDGNNTYLWTPTDGLSSSSIKSPLASPSQTTVYTITIKDSSGCSVSGNVEVRLKNVFLKAAIEAPLVACPNENVLFKDTSTGAIITWNWNFGNGNSSILQHPPLQRYPVSNDVLYPVSLTVTDTAGCMQSVYSYIKTVNNCYMAVPSAFSPNGDGLNDYLYPLNAYKATNLCFKVFNRRGMLVYNSNNWLTKWDGSLNGEPQAPGTYVWMLTYNDENKRPVSLKGSVLLIR